MFHEKLIPAMITALFAKYLILEPYLLALSEQLTTGMALTAGVIAFWILKDKYD